jgi:hypothetical protein
MTLRPTAVPLVLAALLAAACSPSAASRRPGVVPEPIVSEPLRPLPPPSPLAVLVSATKTVGKQLATLPCPPPGLPPEIAARVDCAAMRPFEEATAWIPRDLERGALPRDVDLRAHGLVGPVRDQLQVGACAGFAMTAVLDNGNRRIGRTEPTSALHVFATYAPTGDDFSRSLKHRAFTSEPTWAYDPGRACYFARDYMGESCVSHYGVYPGSAPQNPWVLSERDQADARGRVRILGYEEMPRDPDQWAFVLASGEALWVAFEFERGAWDSLNGNAGSHLPWYPSDANAIGHAVALIGYRTTPAGREFLFQNSWSPRWAAGGFAWVAEPLAVEKFKYGYRVLASDAAVPPPPTTDGATTPALPWPAGLPAWLPSTSAPSTVPSLPGGFSFPGLPAGLPTPF